MPIDNAPDCVQQGVSPDDGTVVPYEECSGFYTFAPGGVYDPEGGSPTFRDASTGLLLVTALGFIVMLAALVAWVKTEDTKLRAQAARLRRATADPAAHGETVPAPGLTPEA